MKFLFFVAGEQLEALSPAQKKEISRVLSDTMSDFYTNQSDELARIGGEDGH